MYFPILIMYFWNCEMRFNGLLKIDVFQESSDCGSVVTIPIVQPLLPI